MKIALRILAGLVALAAAAVLAFYLATYHPADVQKEAVTSPADAPVLAKGQKIKVLSWNVQFMAGKNYVFFFDEWDESGPDLRPSKADITATFGEVARIIKDEQPDIILLQELDSGAARTDGEDQLARLLPLLPPEYSSYASAWYWKAAFVPHPKIMGPVGMKLGIISKYKISDAVRYQLPQMPNNVVVSNLQFKRAVLEAVFPVQGGGKLSAMSIHQDAFAQGSDTMQRQVELVSTVLTEKEVTGGAWVIGGDFNLLPPSRGAYDRLPTDERAYFQPDSEIARLYDAFKAFPSKEMVEGPDAARYFTHWANRGTAADRTIDYFFVGKNTAADSFRVRQADTARISDHFPVIIELTVP
jgi:endonuclease/exonuclease/phosphatase family metal-dependent hydrolase